MNSTSRESRSGSESYLALALVWLPRTRPQAPTPSTVAHAGTTVFTYRNKFKSPVITHTYKDTHTDTNTAFRDLLLVKSSAHLAVRQPCESPFGLGWLEELYDGGES